MSFAIHRPDDIIGMTPTSAKTSLMQKIPAPESSATRSQTALQERLLDAASKGLHLDIEHLISIGADPNIPDSFGWTPTSISTMNKHHLCVQTLLDAGANPNIPDRGNLTPLMFSVIEGSMQCFRLLLSKSSPDTASAIFSKDYPDHNDQWSLLSLATINRRLEFVEEILSARARPAGDEEMAISKIRPQLGPKSILAIEDKAIGHRIIAHIEGFMLAMETNQSQTIARPPSI